MSNSGINVHYHNLIENLHILYWADTRLTMWWATRLAVGGRLICAIQDSRTTYKKAPQDDCGSTISYWAPSCTLLKLTNAVRLLWFYDIIFKIFYDLILGSFMYLEVGQCSRTTVQNYWKKYSMILKYELRLQTERQVDVEVDLNKSSSGKYRTRCRRKHRV